MFKMGCSMAKKILAIDGNKTSSSQSSSGSAQAGPSSSAGSATYSKKPVKDQNQQQQQQQQQNKSEELNDYSKLEEDPRLPLNVRQIFKITKSWKAIARTMSKTGTAMFLNLFEQNQEIFYLFDRFQHLKGKELHDSMELREHAATVMSTLDQSINSLSDYDNFVTYLHSIGKLHRKVPGFKREHFWKIEQPFLKAVKQTLDERCNETIEEIYKIAIKLIIETIADGYGEDVPMDESEVKQQPNESSGNGQGGGGGGYKSSGGDGSTKGGPANSGNGHNNNSSKSSTNFRNNGNGSHKPSQRQVSTINESTDQRHRGNRHTTSSATKKMEPIDSQQRPSELEALMNSKTACSMINATSSKQKCQEEASSFMGHITIQQIEPQPQQLREERLKATITCLRELLFASMLTTAQADGTTKRCPQGGKGNNKQASSNEQATAAAPIDNLTRKAEVDLEQTGTAERAVVLDEVGSAELKKASSIGEETKAGACCDHPSSIDRDANNRLPMNCSFQHHHHHRCQEDDNRGNKQPLGQQIDQHQQQHGRRQSYFLSRLRSLVSSSRILNCSLVSMIGQDRKQTKTKRMKPLHSSRFELDRDWQVTVETNRIRKRNVNLACKNNNNTHSYACLLSDATCEQTRSTIGWRQQQGIRSSSNEASEVEENVHLIKISKEVSELARGYKGSGEIVNRDRDRATKQSGRRLLNVVSGKSYGPALASTFFNKKPANLADNDDDLNITDNKRYIKELRQTVTKATTISGDLRESFVSHDLPCKVEGPEARSEGNSMKTKQRRDYEIEAQHSKRQLLREQGENPRSVLGGLIESGESTSTAAGTAKMNRIKPEKAWFQLTSSLRSHCNHRYLARASNKRTNKQNGLIEQPVEGQSNLLSLCRYAHSRDHNNDPRRYPHTIEQSSGERLDSKLSQEQQRKDQMRESTSLSEQTKSDVCLSSFSRLQFKIKQSPLLRAPKLLLRRLNYSTKPEWHQWTSEGISGVGGGDVGNNKDITTQADACLDKCNQWLSGSQFASSRQQQHRYQQLMQNWLTRPDKPEAPHEVNEANNNNTEFQCSTRYMSSESIPEQKPLKHHDDGSELVSASGSGMMMFKMMANTSHSCPNPPAPQSRHRKLTSNAGDLSELIKMLALTLLTSYRDELNEHVMAPGRPNHQHDHHHHNNLANATSRIEAH